MTKTGGVALTMEDLRLLLWCASIVEVILEGPRTEEGPPTMDGGQLLLAVKRVRQAMLNLEEVTVIPTMDKA